MNTKRWIAGLLIVLLGTATIWFRQVRAEREVLQTRIAAVQRGAIRVIGENAGLRDELQLAREQVRSSQAELAGVRAELLADLARTPESISPLTPERVQRWLSEANDPTVMRRLNLQARFQTLRHYGALFEQLKLEPQQTARLAILLADKRQSALDTAVTAFQRGEDLSREPDRYREIVSAAQDEIEKQIGELLGETKYAQYLEYDHRAGQGIVRENMEISLHDSSDPLTPEQAVRMGEVLQASKAPRITAAVVEESKSFLSPVQWQVLQDLRAVEEADEQAKIQQLQAALTPLPTGPAGN